MSDIVELYQNGSINGWSGEQLAREAWDMLKGQSHFVPFKGFSSTPAGKRKMFLWEIFRKVMGRDMSTSTQPVGNCVSEGMRTCIEHLMCSEILLDNDFEKWRPVFQPYLYGCGRVFIGGGRLGNSDGSIGAWQADAVIKYGVLPSDENGVPEYTGSVTRQWGAGSGPPQKFVELGKKHLIKSAAMITTWDELMDALMSGHPVSVCSDAGFSMTPNSNGYHVRNTTWYHCMAFIGADETVGDGEAYLKNSWGDSVHGTLVYRDGSGEKVPTGCLRITRKDAEYMLKQKDSFAISAFNGFEDRSREIQKHLFKMI